MAVLVSCPITRPPSPSPSNKVSRRLPALPVRASVQTPSSGELSPPLRLVGVSSSFPSFLLPAEVPEASLASVIWLLFFLISLFLVSLGCHFDWARLKNRVLAANLCRRALGNGAYGSGDVSRESSVAFCEHSLSTDDGFKFEWLGFTFEVNSQIEEVEDAAYYSHQRENVATLGGKMSMRTHVPSDIDQTLSSCYCSPSVPANSQIINLEEAGLTIMKILYIHHMIMECMSDHQKMASVTFTKSLVVVNALMLTLPFKALAETCELNIKSFSMSLLFTIALIGATVGGLLARQRRGELKRLNDQLRQINEALRRQAKMESYAPNLSYAPVGVPEAEVIVDPRKGELVTSLRAGKNFLRNQDPEKAFVEFKAALNFAQSMGDHIEEKKAVRGLGASLQRQGKHKEAIKYHSKVLEIAKRSGEDSGCTEAYGAIADCYTELGDLDQAGKFYDKYIARLKSD